MAALGTNKLQGSMGTATATLIMIRKKKIRWRDTRHLMLTALVGASLGSLAVQFINTKALSFVIPIVLFFIAVYFLLAPFIDTNKGKPKGDSVSKGSDGLYAYIVVPAIGFYDGMFGPGTGSFFALSGVLCKGKDLIAATTIAKPLNFSTNIASLVVFLFAGQIVWLAGVLMMLGQVLGAWLGAHFLFKINPAYLRIIIVIMSVGMLIRYGLSMK